MKHNKTHILYHRFISHIGIYAITQGDHDVIFYNVMPRQFPHSNF
uniref:Uncharacterized protein n=1 Tax=Arundo donax TaxID=35708 RepID=A0A0A9GVK8_ARUDO